MVSLGAVIDHYNHVFKEKVEAALKHQDDLIKITEKELSEATSKKQKEQIAEQLKLYKEERESCKKVRISDFSNFSKSIGSFEESEDRKDSLY